MVACIVRFNMKRCRSPEKVFCLNNDSTLQRILINNYFYSMPVKKQASEKLKSLKPSGKREENFFELVFEVARQIPKGRVTSYGAIAAALGTNSSSRMVGWAMNGCHNAKPKVPAHRVVNRNG